jgi:hypothetical protein
MDLFALVAALLGMFVASAGHVVIGSTLVAVPLMLLAGALVRLRTERLALVYSYLGWYLVLSLAALATLALAIWLPRALAVAFGFAFYYFGAAVLAEGRVRYVPWGTGFQAQTATRTKRFLAYWLIVGVAFATSAVLLALALLTLSGRLSW